MGNCLKCCAKIGNLPRWAHTMWELRAFLLIMQSCISGAAVISFELVKEESSDRENAYKQANPDEFFEDRVIDCIEWDPNALPGTRGALFGIFMPAVIFAMALAAYSLRFTYKRRWGTLAYSFAWVELKKQIWYKRILIIATTLAVAGCLFIFLAIAPTGLLGSNEEHPNAGNLYWMLLNVLVALGMGISDLWRETPDTVEFQFKLEEGDEEKIVIFNDMFVNGYFTTCESFKDMLEDATIEFELLKKKNPDDPNKGRALARLIPPAKNQRAIELIRKKYPATQNMSDIDALQYRIRKSFKPTPPERDLWPWCTCLPCIPGCGANTYVEPMDGEEAAAGAEKAEI